MKPVPGSKIVGREKLCNDCEGMGRDGVVEHVNIFFNNYLIPVYQLPYTTTL